MSLSEIGSEFHSMPCGNDTGVHFPKQIKEYTLTFSGRTSIETVLRNEPQIKKALLPSYCCDSMIEPFRRAGIEMHFFPVWFDDGLKIDIKIRDDIDCVLWCNYFGFKQYMPDFRMFIDRGGVLIEDITHSFYSEVQYNKQSNYLVASLRKWEPVNCGGYCAAVSEKLIYKPENEPPISFVTEKRQAMEKKTLYLQGNNDIEKSGFLADFERSNSWIKENYSGLLIDKESEQYLRFADQRFEKKQRKSNAKYLYQRIKTNKNIDFLFDESKIDCPLFVPIVIHNGLRDVIRKELIIRDIYCPIHWPHPRAYCESNLYDMELSLICDQRYAEKDMEVIVSTLNDLSNYVR